MDQQEDKIVSMVIEEYDVINEEATERVDGVEEGEDSSLEQPVDESDLLSTDRIQSSDINQTSSSNEGRQQETEKQTESISDKRELGKSSKCNDGEESIQYELLCPRVNCTEKIVICLDFSSEMDKSKFRTRAGDKFTPLKLVKRALGFYVQSKHRLDSRHEFALMLLQDTAIWLRDFTCDPQEIVNMLEDLEDTAACENCDLSTLFQTIYDRITMPTVDGDPVILPPSYIVRVLLIYGRSHCRLDLPHKEAQRALFSSPYFFVDAFYIHETPSEENNCEEIFDSLCDLDYKGFSYIFEASRNPTKVYDCMAQLLAHPLQRPAQKETSYKLKLKMAAE